jgi:hypothetical protein
VSADTPGDADLLLEAGRAAVARVHTCLPGVVVSYDRTKQSATVQPAVRGRYKDPSTGELVTYQMPVIANVPVAFPSGAGLSITWDLESGDPVTLVFAERSIDEWKTVGGSDATPRDVRRHDLSDAIAIPGGRPFSDPVPAAGYAENAGVLRCDDLRLGSAAASDFVALASLVLARLNAIVTAFNTHTHPTGVGPTGTPVTPMGVPASVAATKVKAE